MRKEVFRGGENRGAHRRGSELAAFAVLTFAVACYCVYARWTGFVTGLLLGGCRAAPRQQRRLWSTRSRGMGRWLCAGGPITHAACRLQQLHGDCRRVRS